MPAITITAGTAARHDQNRKGTGNSASRNTFPILSNKSGAAQADGNRGKAHTAVPSPFTFPATITALARRLMM